MRKIAVALFLGFLALSARTAVAQTHEQYLEDLAIEGANTPAQHEALADHFRAKAADARAEAKRHESMAKSYGLGPVKLTQKAQMQQHCKKIAANAESTAAEYEAMAKVHEDEAKKK